MTLNEQLNGILSDLRTSVPEIRGALIASTDGMVISANVSGGDINRMAAMVSTALGLGKRICETFAGGELNETTVSGAQGLIYIYAAGSRGVLAVIAAAGSNVGLLHLESRDRAKQIASALG